jgi:hypothetical protein
MALHLSFRTADCELPEIDAAIAPGMLSHPLCFVTLCCVVVFIIGKTSCLFLSFCFRIRKTVFSFFINSVVHGTKSFYGNLSCFGTPLASEGSSKW